MKIEIPEGYKEVAVGDVQVGDLAYNVISQQWEKISEWLLVLNSSFGKDKELWMHRPIRKVMNDENYYPENHTLDVKGDIAGGLHEQLLRLER